MEDVVLQSNRFFLPSVSSTSVVLYFIGTLWLTIQYTLNICIRLDLYMFTYFIKPPWFSFPCFGKYFLCSHLSNCLYHCIYTHILSFLPPQSPCLLHYNMYQNRHNKDLSKGMHVYRWGPLLNCTSSFINNKHHAWLCRHWNPSNLQGFTCTYKTLWTSPVIIYVQYIFHLCSQA